MEISKEIWGLIYGLITLIPGFGVSSAVLFSYNHNDSIPYTIAAALMFNSIKEVALPFISNNIETQSIDSINLQFDKHSFFTQLIKYKIITWLVGLIVGSILPIRMFPIQVSIIISLAFILRLKPKEIIATIIWLTLVSVVFILTNKQTNQILLIGMILFTIPSVIDYYLQHKYKTENKTENKLIKTDIEVNEFQLAIAGIISIICPGISPTLITSQLGDGTLNTLATSTCINTFIEACGLVLLIRNISNGKSLIGLELSVANIYTLIGCTGVLFISYAIIYIIGFPLIDFYTNNESFTVFMTTSITISIITIQFSQALFFIPILFFISFIFTKIPTPRNLKGLTFISPILFT